MEETIIPESDSAISILHSLRKTHEDKKHLNGIIFLILLGIFIIDVITIFGVRQNNLTNWGWIGLWVLIVALGMMLKNYIEEKNWINTIDEFYLNKMLKYKTKKDEVKNQS